MFSRRGLVKDLKLSILSIHMAWILRFVPVMRMLFDEVVEAEPFLMPKFANTMIISANCSVRFR